MQPLVDPPSAESIASAAHRRWQARGGAVGDELDDWLAAERGLRFAQLYEVATLHGLDGPATARRVGREERRVCRFCEQAAPRVPFTDPAPVWPACLGPGPIALDQCDDCRFPGQLALEPALAAFLALARCEACPQAPSGLPVTAYKALLRAALALMPLDDLDLCPDAVEWVGNPEPWLDRRILPGLPPWLHRGPGLPSRAWAALVRRRDDEARYPFLIAFLGTPGLVFQIPIPRCARDEEFDGRILAPDPVCRPDDPAGWHGPVGTIELTLTCDVAAPRRRLGLSRVH